MAKKCFNLFAAAILMMALLSCHHSTEPIVNNVPLIPLNVGNYWLYQGYDLDPNDGSVTGTDLWKFGFKIHNPSTKTINGANYTQYQISICGEDLQPIDDTSYLLYGGSKLVYQNQSGFYYSGIVRKDTLTMSFNDLIFPVPAVKVKSVNGHVFYYDNLGNGSNVPYEAITQYTCVSTDSLFTTPLGNFRCIVYKMAWQDFEPLFRNDVYYFIKPGLGIVGMIQMVYFYNLNKYNYMNKIVLTNYKLN